MIMNRRAMAWGALIAVAIMIVTLGLCAMARAQAPTVAHGDRAARVQLAMPPGTMIAVQDDTGVVSPYVKVEEISEVMRESMVLADQLTVCAHELRRMQAAVEALPDPPSRVVWFTAGLAAGLLIGASAALVAR